jgi:hypothetical protein
MRWLTLNSRGGIIGEREVYPSQAAAQSSSDPPTTNKEIVAADLPRSTCRLRDKISSGILTACFALVKSKKKANHSGND